MNRRDFLYCFPSLAVLGAAETRKITVGAHPWVYAASQPKYDPTPVVEQIFRESERRASTPSN